MDASDADVGREKPLRLLNVTATRLTEFEYRQYSLFDSVDYEKLEKANQAIDQIRAKFGENAVMRAAFFKEQRVSYERWTE